MGLSGYLSLLRWAGSKKDLIPKVRTEAAGSIRYVEPFLGSAAVLLNLGEHMTCIGGDENQDLIETFRTVRDAPDEVIRHFHSMENEKQKYLEIRELDRTAKFLELDSSFKAARFIYLNHTCFNGLYRVNLKGEFNVPFGNRKFDASEVEKRIRLTSAKLRDLQEVSGQENLHRGDYRILLEQARNGDFFYLDPPYSELHSSEMFVGYTAAGFASHHHSELIQWMSEVRDMGVRVLMSNSAHPEVLDLAKRLELSVELKAVRRKIAASNSSRGRTEEAIIANY